MISYGHGQCVVSHCDQGRCYYYRITIIAVKLVIGTCQTSLRCAGSRLELWSRPAMVSIHCWTTGSQVPPVVEAVEKTQKRA